MDTTEKRSLWICPECGARLVTRNLYHSCGSFTLEGLFARCTPEALALARTYVDLLHALGDVQILPQKTRLVCVARVRFAGLTPLKNGFLTTFALQRWVESPRLTHLAEFGPRWCMHRLRVESVDAFDEELSAWLQESHDIVGLQAPK